MNQSDLVNLIGNMLTQLDNTLMTLDPTSAQWTQLYALRKHLDDQQRDLVASSIAADDVQFQTLTGLITTANNALTAQIAAQNQIAAVINTVAQVSANLDQVLKMV